MISELACIVLGVLAVAISTWQFAKALSQGQHNVEQERLERDRPRILLPSPPESEAAGRHPGISASPAVGARRSPYTWGVDIRTAEEERWTR